MGGKKKNQECAYEDRLPSKGHLVPSKGVFLLTRSKDKFCIPSLQRMRKKGY